MVVDLHVVRITPRLGIAVGDKPDKIGKQLMEALPKKCGVRSEWPFHFCVEKFAVQPIQNAKSV